LETIPGIKRPELHEMPQIEDRVSFLYLECCQINRESGAIVIKDKNGVTSIPANTLMVLMLGPGTTITHRAVELIGDAGVSIIWVGENGVKYYASGRSLTTKSSMLLVQAECVTNQRKHLAIVRKMYEKRFPTENVDQLTLQQLRGREGARVRAAYKAASKQWGIEWNGRNYKPGVFESSDLVNQALSVATQCLYGICLSVISALGCSPGLGFVHVGHENSFVYDIADLYKVEISVPIAFEIASSKEKNIASVVRRRMRDEIMKKHLMERIVSDIHDLLSSFQNLPPESEETEMQLWNGKGTVTYGTQYGPVEVIE